ncbi:MAG: phosphatidate cytidylyltransferase [Gammaproteobacteria bacterium]|nr:phosphatidate cytidylyltransferase [Gammaproteobacteria bacterium]NNF50697.1 phosphatidate cytidylyltransferase [Woeseiaceae bacterium]MBT8093959.1 phosphatidate cytidylyltransferase [Gammaproteobacteria bacterium]MBT8106575.1 phosphatidate cytidylyltransferase [Gammaproteobacteria bacterium]NNK26590.1 phosphatidate cytidylyltransferase [Woeseiaceae bacterium]
MLKVRVITTLVALVAIAAVLWFVPTPYTEVLVGLLMLAGAWEWAGFLGAEGPAIRIGYVLLAGAVMAAVYMQLPAQTELVLQIAFAWWLIAFFWTFRFPTPIRAPVRWVCGLLVLVPLFVALVTLLRLGIEYLLFVLFIVWLADGGAYFAGKWLGRVKLAPEISPGKTWEGVGGGLLLVSLLAVSVAMWRDISIAVLWPFCLAVAAISIVGDLTVSMFKRTAGLKDSGSLFPGHGGVLDRTDSIAAAAPVFALGLSWLDLI